MWSDEWLRNKNSQIGTPYMEYLGKVTGLERLLQTDSSYPKIGHTTSDLVTNTIYTWIYLFNAWNM